MPSQKDHFIIVCRGSWLSRAQADIFKEKIVAAFPGTQVSIIVKDTTGDLLQEKPMHEMEGKDFFTKDIQEYLKTGQADFAVHSLKDVSGENFFHGHHYAIIDREDPRDVVIFNSSIIDKLKRNDEIIIGTSSPRRSLMATSFLQHALPQLNGAARIKAESIRGNVDTRLRKLNDGRYDGIILAVAGLNRLLRYEPSMNDVNALLSDKKIMVLPLIECPPAPGQGAIVAETLPTNLEAINILKSINNPQLEEATKKEKRHSERYGKGCHQQFGVIHLNTPHLSFTYGSGRKADGTDFTEYHFNNHVLPVGKIFSTGDYMSSFFEYEFLNDVEWTTSKVFFIASHQAVHNETILQKLHRAAVWTSGSKTWLKLAKKGLWVQGCADALGFEFVRQWLSKPLIKINTCYITIVTDTETAKNWNVYGFRTIATYTTKHTVTKELIDQIKEADVLFWTSFRQFLIYQTYAKSGAAHCCSEGRTATYFLEHRIPVHVFPGIKAFNEWRKNSTIVPNAG